MLKACIVFTILVLGLSACQNPDSKTRYTPGEIDSLKKAFERYTAEKDSQFQTADWSPLTDADKTHFKGLHYFPYQIEWRFELPIHRYQTTDSIIIRGTGEDDLRPALKYGYIEFEKDNRTHRLQIIKILPRKEGGKSHLFLGFRDQTSGRSTYGGGRYINLKTKKDGQYIIDFNYAYNPYCAYSQRYSCAIPPKANDLDIAVSAGEKTYDDQH